MILSHYTTRSGLEGIARTAALWATNFLTVNDKSEFLYAWEKIAKAAIAYAVERIPSDLKTSAVDIDAVSAAITQQLREQLASSGGYGQPYMTSFALAKTEDQELEGILTLWDRYTKLEGYCLQYRREDIEHMVRLDSTHRNYLMIALSEVTYGVDENSTTFKQLAMQVGEQLLLAIAKATHDGRVSVRFEKLWPTTHLERQIMQFCGTHKHPAFEDEREFRILTYPSDQTDVRVFTGLATSKAIYDGPAGKRHLVIGDDWRPGVEPIRIIVGPNADPNINEILQLFNRRPEIRRSNIPIVA